MDTRIPALGAFNRAVRIAWRQLDTPEGHSPSRKIAQLPTTPQGPNARHLPTVLAQHGFTHVTLDLDLLIEAHQDRAVRWMEAWLGPAQSVTADGQRMAWRLDNVDSNAIALPAPLDTPPSTDP